MCQKIQNVCFPWRLFLCRDAVCNKGKNKLTDEQFEDLFQAVDCDDDGKINCNGKSYLKSRPRGDNCRNC